MRKVRDAPDAPKLSMAIAEEIRQLCASGPRGTQKALAKRFGVCPSMITAIVKGHTWRREAI